MADFLEFGELMCLDALHREESCGGHFREEYQTAGRRGAARRRALRLRRGVGVHGRRAARRCCTRSRSSSRTCTCRSGATSERMNLTLQVWRQAGATPTGRLVRLRGPRRQPATCRSSRCSTCVNERLIAQGRGADRLRPRLPRGHLRHVRPDDQRRGARPAARHHHLPAAHAQLQGRRRDLRSSRGARAAFPVIKDLVVDRGAFDRIIAAGGFITAPTGSAPDAQRHPGPEGRRRARDGRRRVHRLRRLRGGLPERLGDAVHRARRSRTSACCRRASPSATARALAMVAQMDAEGFGGCTYYGECEAACPKEISIDIIARMNRDYLRAGGHARARGGGRVRPEAGWPWRGLGARARRVVPRRRTALPAQSRAWVRLGAQAVAACEQRGPGARRRRAGRGCAWCSPSSTSTPARWAASRLTAMLDLEGADDTPGRAGPRRLGRRVRRPPPSPHLPRTSWCSPPTICWARRRHGRAFPQRRQGLRAVRHRRSDGPAVPAVSGQPSSGPDPRAGGGDRAPAARDRSPFEAGLFNGDEPERPGQWPRIGGRFGDSWSGRLTGAPMRGLELAGLVRPRPFTGAPARERAPTRTS